MPAWLLTHLLLCCGASLAAIAAAGAPPRALQMQAGAFLAGALLHALLRWRPPPRRWPLAAMVVLALAVACAGVEIDGAQRWLRAGPLLLHPASLAGPLFMAALAEGEIGWQESAAAACVVLALGLGWDGAASLALAAGLSAMLLVRKQTARLLWPVCGLAWLLAAWALARPDPLPAVPWVEGLVAHSLHASAPLGLLAMLALASLPLPFLLAARRAPQPAAPLALAAFWGGLALAGAIANYPHPVLGLGASPVIGWLASLALLPPITATPAPSRR
jgi:cell division protein FtsW (lipid II flippase)